MQTLRAFTFGSFPFTYLYEKADQQNRPSHIPPPHNLSL